MRYSPNKMSAIFEIDFEKSPALLEVFYGMLEVDLVALATSYVGEKKRWSMGGSWATIIQTDGPNAISGSINV